MWEFIDKVIYINLDHREDRREIMKTFFMEGKVPEDKIIRFSAVQDTPGIIGAAKSHIGSLKLAIQNNWKNVLILEDDLQWNNFEENYKKLEKLILNTNYDVCLLGGEYIEIKQEFQIKSSFGTISYIVNSSYYKTLLSNFETGLLKKINEVPRKKYIFSPAYEEYRIHFLKNNNLYYNIDVYWIKLQLKDNWIGIVEPMCKQVESYSDNNNKISTPNKNIYNKDVIDRVRYLFDTNTF